MGSLTEVQHSLVIGSLLGDGYMQCKTHAYLKIGHSIKQRAYVDWKYELLSAFVRTKPKQYRGNGNRVGYRFCTRSLPILTPYFYLFYGKENKKSIPKNLILTPFSLAIWFMDDGSRNRKSIYLNTQQFLVQEQQFLLQLLYIQFGLQGNLNKDKQYWRIRLFQPSAQVFKQLVSPIIPDFMRYKLPL